MRNFHIKEVGTATEKKPSLFCYTGEDKKNKREKTKNWGAVIYMYIHIYIYIYTYMSQVSQQ